LVELRNKTVLLISPQNWGKMFLSKHHYAIELARRGNIVYFLNPPDEKYTERPEKISIEPSGAHKNLYLIYHRTSFPYKIKFYSMPLFHVLIKRHVKKILRLINKPIDIVWSFDIGYLLPFFLFPKSAYKLFHPMDEPQNQHSIYSARGAQIIFSVTQEILDKYSGFKVPKYLINHGVAEYFIIPAQTKAESNHSIHVGFSGNLMRLDIDREIFLHIISENPTIIFECWGSYQMKQSNIGGQENEEVNKFIQSLQAMKNVVLHGVVDAMALAKELNRMDAFLICYDIKKDHSKGTNYHKIMEYLSTGKVIISNNVTTYKNKTDLLQMTSERESNLQLPHLFKQVVNNLNYYNNSVLQQKRIAFAKENTYQKQVDRIEKLIQL
jgi:hypothetical protein